MQLPAFLRNKKSLIRGFLVLSVLVLFALSGVFIFRNSLLDYFTHKFSESLNAKYGIQIHIGSKHFNGLSKVILENVLLSINQKTVAVDSIFFAKKIEADFRIMPLFTGSLRAKELFIDGVVLNLSEVKKIKSPKNTQNVSEKNIGKAWTNLTDAIFKFIPSKLQLNDFQVFNIDSLGRKEVVLNMVFNLNNSIINARMKVLESNNIQDFLIMGELNTRKKKIRIKLFADPNAHLLVPFIEHRYNTTAIFDTLEGVFEKRSSDNFSALYSLRFNKLKLLNTKLSQKEIVFDKLTFSGGLLADKIQIRSDETSMVQINNIKSVFSFSLKPNKPKEFGLIFQFNDVPANVFFESLPEGMFNLVNSIRADGNVSFKTEFFIDTELPDSLRFMAELKKTNFKILSYGHSDLLRMNKSFEYTAYENDMPTRTFIVGNENPDFTQLSGISAYLKNAVLTSEDGSFFYHRGFNEDAFRQSIALNFTKGKFVRGGSTISMQLIKNVFLNRKKNISRKLEEALIVWLIENNRLCSKERMFEVYMNIIEWGPGVYGVKEASQFYFKKNPADLNLAESIFLASIIPRPKSFRYSFDADGKLKGSLAGYYRLVSEILFKKELITQNEYENLLPSVDLTGKARKFILPSDSLINDSLLFDENKFMD